MRDLTDPDLLAAVAATHEDTAQHLRNGLQLAANLRDKLEDALRAPGDDATPEADAFLTDVIQDVLALERRLLLALAVDSRTPKLHPISEEPFHLVPYADTPRHQSFPRPELVRDTMAVEEDDDGA